jgi:hypothetical protein
LHEPTNEKNFMITHKISQLHNRGLSNSIVLTYKREKVHDYTNNKLTAMVPLFLKHPTRSFYYVEMVESLYLYVKDPKATRIRAPIIQIHNQSSPMDLPNELKSRKNAGYSKLAGNQKNLKQYTYTAGSRDDLRRVVSTLGGSFLQCSNSPNDSRKSLEYTILISVLPY